MSLSGVERGVFRVTFTKNNPFAKFYNTAVQIGKVIGGGSYEEPDGIFEVLGEAYADIQPYNGGLAREEYGFNSDVNKRMYCAKNKHLTVGNTVVIGNEQYLIEYVENWEMGIMTLLNKRR